MNYKPDKWVIVKVITNEVIYKVFGCWSGSYLEGNSWRMNSGIVSIKDTGDTYEFVGYSGSTYICRKTCYGSHPYASIILNGMINDASKQDVVIEILDKDTDFLNLKYE